MYRSTANGQNAIFFALMATNQDPYAMAHFSDHIKYQGDWLFFPWRSAGGAIGVKSPISRVDDLVGFANPSRVIREAYLFHKPVATRYTWQQDVRDYGRLLGNNSDLSRFETEFSHENQVRHDRYEGDVEDTVPLSSYMFDKSVDMYGFPYWFHKPAGWTHYHGYTRTGVDPFGEFTYQLWTGGREDDASLSTWYDCYDWFKTVGLQFADANLRLISNTSGFSQYISDVTEESFRTSDKICLRAGYKLSYWDWPYGLWAEFRVKIVMDICFPAFPNARGNHGEDRRILQTAVEIHNFSEVEALAATINGSGVVTGESDASVPLIGYVQGIDSTATDDMATGTFQMFPFSQVIGSNGLPTSNLEAFAVIRDRFRSYVTSILPDLRPASFLSASDGLNNHLSILKTNMLQVLQHAKDIMDLVPDVPGLRDVLIRIAKGDPSALKDLLDILSDIWLTIQFRDKPAIDLVKKVGKIDFFERFRVLLTAKTFITYGKFEWEFPIEQNPFHDGTLKLTVRSKSRVSIDLTDAMMVYLAGNSVGLVPTLSRIWNLLPFTFVVDWFTNMAKRLQAVDDQVTWLCVHHNWSEHSYKVVWTPSPEFLASHGLTSVNPSKPFCLSVYVREKTLITPRLVDSRFDFLRVTRQPDVLTVGSLLWHML